LPHRVTLRKTGIFPSGGHREIPPPLAHGALPVRHCAPLCPPCGRSAWADAATHRRPATTVDSPHRLPLDTDEAARSLRAPRPRAVSSARPSERCAPHCHKAFAGTPDPIRPSLRRIGALVFHRNARVGSVDPPARAGRLKMILGS